MCDTKYFTPEQKSRKTVKTFLKAFQLWNSDAVTQMEYMNEREFESTVCVLFSIINNSHRNRKLKQNQSQTIDIIERFKSHWNNKELCKVSLVVVPGFPGCSETKYARRHNIFAQSIDWRFFFVRLVGRIAEMTTEKLRKVRRQQFKWAFRQWEQIKQSDFVFHLNSLLDFQVCTSIEHTVGMTQFNEIVRCSHFCRVCLNARFDLDVSITLSTVAWKYARVEVFKLCFTCVSVCFAKMNSSGRA